MSLDINEARKVFADHLQANFHKAKSEYRMNQFARHRAAARTVTILETH